MLRVDAQASAAPLDGVAVAGDEVLKRGDGPAGARRADLGLAESPRVGEVLGEVRRRKLNGELDGRESELAAARELISAS